MARGSAGQTALQRALRASRASAKVDFVRGLDPSAAGDWCDLATDVAALANSGGGVIVVGVDGAGRPSGWEPAGLRALDAGGLLDRIAPYVSDVVDLVVAPARKDGHDVVVITVEPRTGAPVLVAGRGADDAAMYFRHGARSEPARATDLERFVSRELRRVRREWLANIAKVTHAGPGSQVVVHPPGAPPDIAVGQEFRVVDDPRAPAVGRTDFDRTHPFREVEVVRLVNESIGGGAIGHYEVQCVRRVHGIDRDERYFHRPKFGSPQYSQVFVDWLVASVRGDPDFFTKAKTADRAAARPPSRPSDG